MTETKKLLRSYKNDTKVRNKNYGILIFYSKFFLLPGYLIKALLILSFFQYPLFRYTCSSGDYFGEIYYILLYTIFLIPVFDFPIIGTVSFIGDKNLPARRILLSLGRAFGGSMLVFLLTIAFATLSVLIVHLFGLPFCSITD